MTKALKVTRLLGLFALALGAMAFSATSAQAESGAHWDINGTPTTTLLNAQIQVSGIETLARTGVKELILVTHSGATKVEILCTAMKFVDALLKLLGGATGKIHFEGCITKLNEGAAAGVCKPHSPGAGQGLIETNALDGLIVLHNNKTVDLFELLPTAAGGPFVTLILGAEGEENECSIGENFDVTGKAFLQANANGEGLEERVDHLFKQGPLTALLFGGNEANIEGSVKAVLAGAHTSMKWSGKAA